MGRGVIGLDRQADQRLHEKEIAIGVQMDLHPAGVRGDVDPAGGGKGRAETVDDRLGEEDLGQVTSVKVNHLQAVQGQGTAGWAVRAALRQRPVLETSDHQVGVRDRAVSWAHECQSGGAPGRTVDRRPSWWDLPFPGPLPEFLVRSWNPSGRALGRTDRYESANFWITRGLHAPGPVAL